ncbi:MAG: flagellum-specific ATP synthase FliI, partial [Firmicutes bacterium]|nr:flagellum-specific ATP synthase FliI [Bacillota bacterium]
FEKGSITGIYTVLVEGDDVNEPISDTVRGIIDGHIVLSRKIASRNHYPAIDILGSVSRLMNDIVTPEQKAAANRLRNYMATYEENYDLVSIGAYKSGSNPELDEALGRIKNINAFLCQATDEKVAYDDTVQLMKNAVE